MKGRWMCFSCYPCGNGGVVYQGSKINCDLCNFFIPPLLSQFNFFLPTQTMSSSIQVLAKRIKDLPIYVKNVQVNQAENALRFDLVSLHDCLTIELYGSSDGIRCRAIQEDYKTLVDAGWQTALREGKDAYHATLSTIRYVTTFSKLRRKRFQEEKKREDAVASVFNPVDREVILKIYDAKETMRLTPDLFNLFFRFSFESAFAWLDRQEDHVRMWEEDPFWRTLQKEYDDKLWKVKPFEWLSFIANAQDSDTDGEVYTQIFNSFIGEYWTQVHLYMGDNLFLEEDKPAKTSEALYQDLRTCILREASASHPAHARIPATLEDAEAKLKVVEDMKAFCEKVKADASDDAEVIELADEVISLLDETWLSV